MRRSPVLLVALLAACSSGSGTTATSSPSDLLPTEVSPSASASSPPTASPLATASPAARVTPSPTRSRAASPAAAPKPHSTHTSAPAPRPAPSPTRKGTTFGVDEVTGYRFSPSALSLQVGDSVLVTDKDSAFPHTFTISALHIDSGAMNQGDTYRYRFLKAGTFDFICDYHKDVGMTGTVTVKA